MPPSFKKLYLVPSFPLRRSLCNARRALTSVAALLGAQTKIFPGWVRRHAAIMPHIVVVLPVPGGPVIKLIPLSVELTLKIAYNWDWLYRFRSCFTNPLGRRDADLLINPSRGFSS